MEVLSILNSWHSTIQIPDDEMLCDENVYVLGAALKIDEMRRIYITTHRKAISIYDYLPLAARIVLRALLE